MILVEPPDSIALARVRQLQVQLGRYFELAVRAEEREDWDEYARLCDLQKQVVCELHDALEWDERISEGN